MSLWRDELKPTGPTMAWVALLAAVGVASLARVVEGPQVYLYGGAAMCIGAALALYFGPRSLGRGFGLLLAGGALTLPAIFTSELTWLPSPQAFRQLGDLMSTGLSEIPQAIPPVGPEPQFLILVWTSMLLLGFLCASWVVVRRPVGAVVSLLALVTFTGSIGEGSGRTWFTLAAVAATGAVFLSEGRHRIQRWTGSRARLRPWLGLPTLAAASAVALAAPAVIGESPIVELQSPGRPRVVVIKPLSDIRRQLEVDPPIEVMRVAADRPAYWRLTALDTYDGTEWVLNARPDEIRDGMVGQPNPPATGDLFEQRYTLTSLLSPWLPAVYAADTIETSAGVEVDIGSQTLLLQEDTAPGLTYTVSSRLPRLEANLPGPPAEVSDETEKAFGRLAEPIVQGAQTPFDMARRLEEHFRAYTYDESVAGGHGVDRLHHFLEERAGYCEQFAAAMTLMLRGLGVGARVGVGFLPGPRQDAEHVVTTRDAHAWVEVEVPGAGWVSFDPTPGRADSAAPPPPATPMPAPEPEQQPVPAPAQPTPVPVDPPPAPGAPSDTPPGTPGPWLWAALALAATGSVPAGKAMRRVQRRRGPPAQAAVGAWTELRDLAADLGWRPSPSETIGEFTRRALQDPGLAHVFNWHAAKALYGSGQISREQAERTWTAGRSAGAELRRRAPAWRKILSPFDPRTLLPKTGIRRSRGN